MGRTSFSWAADVFNKFAASAWGQKLAKRAAKADQTDFDRYKAMVQKIKRSAQVRRWRWTRAVFVLKELGCYAPSRVRRHLRGTECASWM